MDTSKQNIGRLIDESRKTISLASQFFPRFFTPVSETYNDLFSVLNKMMKQNDED